MADNEKDRNPSYSMFGLGDSETRGSAPAGAPTASGPEVPQYVYQQAPPPAASGGVASGHIMLLLIVVLLVVSGVNLYLVITARQVFKDTTSKQADQLDLITRRLDSSDARYAQLRGQFQVTSEKLGLTQEELSRAKSLAANIQKQQKEAVTRLNDAISQKASAEDVNKVQAEANTKIAGVSTDLAGTKKDLADLTGALGSTKGELSGAIARTHDELVALAHKTDRDYFEFKLTRKNAPQRVGNVTLELRKTDTKRNTFTVSLRFDDKVTERKDKAAMEPVYFYMQGASSALELVVNKLGKDNIAGYISAPKGFFPNTTNVLAGRPGV